MSCPHGSSPETCSVCQLADTGVGAPLDRAVAPTIRREDAPPEAPTEQVVVPEPAPAGGRLGRFIIIEAVGQGGMGVVYRGYDPALDRRVALKVLRGRAAAGDTGGTARLAREAQAMARLAHPNVVPVYDVGRTGDSLFVAMEFVLGATLQGWLAQKRPWREVLEVCVQAGRGLEAAHAAGIIHRDFKPANVLVGQDGRARVTDFGLARSSGDTDRPSTPIAAGSISLETPLTIAGAVMGTPGYMAPEQYLGQESTPATDQYAFCATLYEALYGQRPFIAADLKTMARLTQAGEVPPPPKGSTVPAWLFPLITRGLSPNPAQRHPSMGVLLELLEKDPSQRRRRLGLTAGAVVVTLTVGAALLAWPTVRASSCHAETDRLASVWDDAARSRVERAFVATKQPFVQAALDFVRTNLDGFLASWVAERHRACDDTLLERTRTERQLALRLSCLENRRVELQTLANRFQQADVQMVTQAAAAVSRLSTVERCANVEVLEARAGLDEAVRSRAEAIEQRLSEGRMLVALGRFDDARPMLTEALASARALGEPQTLASSLVELGSLEREVDHYAAARTALDEAVRLALAARDDHSSLRALGLLSSLVGWRLGVPQEGLALVNFGRGLVPRVNDLALEALLDEGEGDSRWAMDDYEGALRAYHHALELLVRVQGEGGLDVARMDSSVAWVLVEGGQLSKAKEMYDRSRRSREALLGETHPTLGTTWNELGFLAREFDDREAAVSGLRRALELRVRAKGPDSQVAGQGAANLAGALILVGRLDEARSLLREAERVLELNTDSRASFGKVRCRLLIASGELEAALSVAMELRGVGTGELSIAESEGLLGEVQAAMGDEREAVRHLEATLAVYERLRAHRKQRYAHFTLVLAEAHGRLKSPESRAAAEKAHEAALRLEGNSRLKAKSSFQLAKALLANGATEQARQAAAQALTFAVEPDMKPLSLEAEKFLAEHADE